MNSDELESARERLGLSDEAGPDDIRRRFAELHADLRLRIDNAPTPRLRTGFERSLTELESAYRLLMGTNGLDASEAMPLTGPINVNVDSAPHAGGATFASAMTRSDALKVLGCPIDAPPSRVRESYKRLQAEYQHEMSRAPLGAAKEAYKRELARVEAAWKAVAHWAGSVHDNPNLDSKSKPQVKVKSRYLPITMVVSLVLAIILAALWLLWPRGGRPAAGLAELRVLADTSGELSVAGLAGAWADTSWTLRAEPDSAYTFAVAAGRYEVKLESGMDRWSDTVSAEPGGRVQARTGLLGVASARQEAERQRQEAERARQVEAERQRIEAERARQAEAERQRIEAERARQVEAERQRIEAERARQVEAERQRIEAERARQAETVVVEKPSNINPKGIYGTVRTGSGSAIEGVRILVVELNRGVITGRDGNYIILNVPDGQYNIRIFADGFLSQTSTVVVKNGQYQLNVVLTRTRK